MALLFIEETEKNLFVFRMNVMPINSFNLVHHFARYLRKLKTSLFSQNLEYDLLNKYINKAVDFYYESLQCCIITNNLIINDALQLTLEHIDKQRF